jgi:pyruvate/2-oxoglutarate dehydrogenase complex dihydrolipoamide dehydrogenase (E3) component
MYDVIVLGGGPAGVTAALRARELGATVALAERGRMGGTCTNDGCVPTRVLAKAARLVRDAEQFGTYGLRGEVPAVDFGAVIARTQQVVDAVHDKKQLLTHLDQAGVEVFAPAGNVHFVDEHTVELEDGTQLEGETIIICAGGRARRLPFPGGEYALTHSDVWTMTEMPRSVAIVGAAATGCQLASVFAAFGAQVWLLDLAPRLLAGEDAAVGEEIGAAFRRRDIQVVTGIGGVERIDKKDDTLTLVYKQGDEVQTLDVDAVIMAVGWPGNVDRLNLDAAGIKAERSYIVVDDHLRTSTPHIFAAGDINGRMMLVQSGIGEARVAAENAVLGMERTYQHRIVPHGGFTDPEYGCVGLTEEQAGQEHDIAVAVVPYADLDRAVIDDRQEGFCKLIIARDTRRILGAHVVGEDAVEVVQIVAAGMATNMRVEQLAELELAYPTFAAIVGLAARQLVRELGVVPLARQWQNLRRPRVAEWERSRNI